ncbi:MAG: ABC transporter ATP-binding protein [Anaerolineae bacterium]|nr:ABC transporter ATP-binding protein [Anaerolineae bacterium]
MEAIRTEGLRKQFGAVHALSGLDLHVEPGSVFGFLGPNGAGKTTTIRILTGLAWATGGRAWVTGVEIPAGSKEVAHRIGYLPEEPAFYPWMTARELLEHVGRTFGLSRSDREARIDELLALTGLAEAARRRIGGFSHGMRQRLGIAQALVNRPAVLFLDEPVSALDPAGRRDVLELIGRLKGETTVFMSTHILADVERVCDTVGIIANGQMLVTARQDELLARYATPAFEIETDAESAAGLASWAERARRTPWAAEVTIDGRAARVIVHDVAQAKRELLPLALEAGLTLARYEIVRPSLEDVFLHLVENGGAE